MPNSVGGIQSPTEDVFQSPALVSPQAVNDVSFTRLSPPPPPPPPPYTEAGLGKGPQPQDYSALFGSILGDGGGVAEVSRDTLDESLWDTLKRDYDGIVAKLTIVLSAGQANADGSTGLNEWDMWGPLLFSLLLAGSLSSRVGSSSSLIFELCLLLVWGGSVAVYANARLLGHRASVMHTICYLGYSIFPLSLVAALGMVLRVAIVNSVLVLCALGWCVSASSKFFSDPQLESKRLLISFPVLLYYFTVSWLCMIS